MYQSMMPIVIAALLMQSVALFAQESAQKPALWCRYDGTADRPGAGKHIVLVAGDDEYRSEEALPMIGKILARHHGFQCTVLFPINPDDQTIQPDFQTNIPGMHWIESADVLILALRFRNLPDNDMKYLVDYVERGKPIIGLRTSTHAFRIPQERKFASYSFDSAVWKGGFGQQVLGDTWISHHGQHGRQSTRGIIEPGNRNHPILKGATDVWGPTDVYGIQNLPASATILLRGQVVDGMNSTDPAVAGPLNSPMMPLAWVRELEKTSSAQSRVFCTTMGAATDFQSAGLRRLVVNATYWCAGLESAITAESNVEYVGPYEPTTFGFGGYQKGKRPADYAIR
jgi:hypothetical protein